MATRAQNERRYPVWVNLPNGGRLYYRIVEGFTQGYARYVKEVDVEEVTIRIVQEIYDDSGRLIGRHQKYPIDTGHEWMLEE